MRLRRDTRSRRDRAAFVIVATCLLAVAACGASIPTSSSVVAEIAPSPPVEALLRSPSDQVTAASGFIDLFDPRAVISSGKTPEGSGVIRANLPEGIDSAQSHRDFVEQLNAAIRAMLDINRAILDVENEVKRNIVANM